MFGFSVFPMDFSISCLISFRVFAYNLQAVFPDKFGCFYFLFFHFFFVSECGCKQNCRFNAAAAATTKQQSETTTTTMNSQSNNNNNTRCGREKLRGRWNNNNNSNNKREGNCCGFRWQISP